MVALVEVFIRASGPRNSPATRGQYPTPRVGARQGWTPRLSARKPELDFAGRRLGRIRPVHEVVLGDKCQVTADCAGRGLLNRIGGADNLAKRGNGPRALHDGRHDGPRGDELQQRREERLALVFGIVPTGKVVADVLEFECRDGQALAFDTAEDLPDQAPLDAVGLDQNEGPLSHGRQPNGAATAARAEARASAGAAPRRAGK